MKMLKFFLLLGLIAGCFFAATDTPEYTENSITFQGYLEESDGTTSYRGKVHLGFKFYGSANGSDVIKTTSGTNIEIIKMNVVVFYGNYTTKLAFTKEELEALSEKDGKVWVEVYVKNNDKETIHPDDLFANDCKLTPRIPLGVVPYAVSARGIYYDAEQNGIALGSDYRGRDQNDNIILGNQKQPPQDGLIVQGRVAVGTLTDDNDALNGYQFKVSGNVYLRGNVDISSNSTVQATIVATKNAVIKDILWN